MTAPAPRTPLEMWGGAEDTTGTANLARACRRHAIPLTTFSSDLVFDGHTRRPYLEDDPPCPLNAYRASKVEAERQVRALLPDALVAPADTVVSPTYVPHHVHATLDLLIDGERGVWHLANDGALSWYEFARTLATRAGRRLEHITPCDGAHIWGAVRRPLYSALASQRATVRPRLDDAMNEFLCDAGHQDSGDRVVTCAASG